jgi:hypothetical protein
LKEPNALEKTNRINLLFDFYEELLTEKQRTFLRYYFHENYSLGEIASAFDISRQAVFEHIKRAEASLQEYEDKLQLLSKHEERLKQSEELEELLADLNDARTEEIRRRVRMLAGLDEGDSISGR